MSEKPFADWVKTLGRNPDIDEQRAWHLARRAERDRLREFGPVDTLYPIDIRPREDVDVAELPRSTAASSPHKAAALVAEHDWTIDRVVVIRPDDAVIWATRGTRKLIAGFRDRKFESAYMRGTHAMMTRVWGEFTLLVEWPELLSPPPPPPPADSGPDAPRSLRAALATIERGLGRYLMIGSRVERDAGPADFYAPRIDTERIGALHLMTCHDWTLRQALDARGQLIAEHRALHLAGAPSKRHRHVDDVVEAAS